MKSDSAPPAPPLGPAEEPLVTVVIPAYNEARRLPTTLTRVQHYLEGQPYRYEIIVVDDGSGDETARVAEHFAPADSRLRVIRNPHMGKGVAVRAGMLAGAGRYILYTDADLSAPIAELSKLLGWLQRGYDVAIGSREGPGARRYNEPGYRHLMGRVFNKIVQLIALRQFNDTQCGFKAFTREASQDLFHRVQIYGDNARQVTGPMVTGFDVEVLYLALKRHYCVKEVPVEWYYASGSKVSPARDSLRLFRDVFHVRWNDLRGKYGQPGPARQHTTS